MSNTYYDNRHEEKNGHVVVFTRAGAKKPIWHYRLFVKGSTSADGSKQQYVQRSSGTTDKAEAIRIALDEYEHIKYRTRQKKPVSDSTFAQLYDLWFTTKKRVGLEMRFKAKGRVGRIARVTWYQVHANKYWLPYFGKYLLNDLTNTICSDYWNWRENYWKNASEEEKKASPNHAMNPAKGSLKMEQSALREFFKWAHSEGLLEHIPDFTSPYTRDGSKEKRRPSLDKREWQTLDRYMRDKWVLGQGVNDKGKKWPDSVLFNREMCRRYIQFIQSTGMRPGELLKIRHRDIERVKTKSGAEILRITVPRDTKTGTRVVHSMKGTVRYYDAIRKISKALNPDDLVFTRIDGGMLSTNGYILTIKALLRELNMYLDSNGDSRSAYSFRHYYAEQRLDEIGTHPKALDYIAENMGTSWLMLQNFYIRKGRNIDVDTLTSYKDDFDI